MHLIVNIFKYTHVQGMLGTYHTIKLYVSRIDGN